MNQDILEGIWKQFRGEAKQLWGQLTDDDLDLIDGKVDVLIGKLQERYGYTREEAETEVDHFVRDLENRTSNPYTYK